MLKNYAFPILLLALFGLTFTACESGLTNSSAELSDDELITAIQSADKMSVSLEALPSSVRQEVDMRKSIAIASNAHEANDLGFTVEMRTVNRGPVGEASTIYFNAKGRMLQIEGLNGARNGIIKAEDRANIKRAFELIMPYQVVMPDETIITITAEEDYSLIRTWYQENSGIREKFTLVFPINVLIDGEEITMDQDAFEELITSQKNDRKPKMQLKMPYQVQMPDGSFITIETKEDRALIRIWYQENPGVEEKFVYVFPLTVIINDNEIVVNSAEELMRLRRRFANSVDDRSYKACYNIQFPYTLVMPDNSSSITLNKRNDLRLVRTWFAENEDYQGQRPTYQFPITLLVKGEARERVEVGINSQEEFDAYLTENCAG